MSKMLILSMIHDRHVANVLDNLEPAYPIWIQSFSRLEHTGQSYNKTILKNKKTTVTFTVKYQTTPYKSHLLLKKCIGIPSFVRMIQWFTRYVLETLGVESCGFGLVDRTLDISQVRVGGDDTPTHQMFGERDHYFLSLIHI